MLTVERLEQRLMRGSSQPWVAAASDGRRYVVKFAATGSGPDALLAELLVSRLARRWGLPVPAAQPIDLPAGIRAGTDELWDVLDASVGANLAIELVADGHEVALTSGLPDPVLTAIVWIDTLFGNYDRTSLSGNLLRDGSDRFWLIDHGSCRFLHRTADSFALPRNHFLHATDISPQLADISRAALAGIPLDETVRDVPPAWLAPLGLSVDELGARIAALLDAFRAWLDR